MIGLLASGLRRSGPVRTALAGALVVAVALCAWSLAPDVRAAGPLGPQGLALPAGKEAKDAGEPPVLRSAARQRMAEAIQKEREQRHRELSSAPKRQERAESRRKWARLRGASALDVDKRFFDILGRPSWRPADAQPGVRALKYLDSRTMLVRDGAENRKALLVSDTPLWTEDEDGEPARVSTKLVADGDELVTENALVDVAIARDADEGVEFVDQSATLVPVVAEGARVDTVASSDRVTYTNIDRDTDLSISPTAIGVQTHHVLRSVDAPQSLPMKFDLPDGAEIKPVEGGGAAVTKDGKEIGSVSAPIAADAQGQTVQSKLRLDGDEVIVDVEHQGKDLAYPIVVDPTYVIDQNPWYDVTAQAGPWRFGTPWPGYFFLGQTGDGAKYLYSAANANFGHTTWGWMINSVPGAGGGFTYATQFYNLSHSSQGTCVSAGIFNSAAGDWDRDGSHHAYGVGANTGPMVICGSFSGWIVDVCADGNCWGGVPGEVAALQLWMYGTGFRGPNAQTAVGATAAYMRDDDAPYWTDLGDHPGNGVWTRAQTARFVTAARDNGLGMKRTYIRYGDTVRDNTHPCVGTWNSACPANSSTGSETWNLLEGEHTVDYYAADVVDHPISAQRVIRVDRGGPEINLGDVLASRGGPDEPAITDPSISQTSRLSIDVFDGNPGDLSGAAKRSGVDTVTTVLQKKNRDTGAYEGVADSALPAAYDAAACAAGSCPAPARSYTFSPAGKADGIYRVVVTATDFAGNTTTRNVYFRVGNDPRDGGSPGNATPKKASVPEVGMWYSVWYANEGELIKSSGHGVGSTNQLMADVTGDGKADAVAFFGANGNWYVATSNGAMFNTYSLWRDGHGTNSDKQFLADVTGDGKADAVVFFKSTGSWYVAASNGNGFNSYSLWKSGHGVGSTNQLVADVNGDGKADAVTFTGASGTWHAATSTGAGFNNPTQWRTGHGVGSTNQLLGDVTGDGKADAVVFFTGNGSWYVAASNGATFDGYSQWASNLGTGSVEQLLADAVGDSKLDAVVVRTDKKWSVGASGGSDFSAAGSVELWVQEFIGKRHFVANVDGVGKAERIAYGDPAAAYKYKYTYGDGTWRVLPPGYNEPSDYDLWSTFNIKEQPRVGTGYRQYDSGEPAVIREHLDQLEGARVDYLLFDITNNLREPIKARGRAVCAEIKARRAAGRPAPRFAVAVGAIQFTGDLEEIEREAQGVWDAFVTHPACNAAGSTSNYYAMHGKPLLVVYTKDYAQRRAWETAAINKTASSRFTIRWAQGQINSVGTGTHQVEDPGNYFGWITKNGPLGGRGSETMVVMPGVQNDGGVVATRDPGGNPGAFYRWNWDRILAVHHGYSFLNYGTWIAGHGAGSNRRFLADVTGDGKDDAVVYFANTGSWYVAAANGDGYGYYSLWKSGHGVGSSNQMLADVTGDGKADAVAYFSDGRWFAATSFGSGFNNYSLWRDGHGVGSANQMLADVTGDKRADAVAYFSDGRWFVATSWGGGFNGYSQWGSGHGVGSQKRMLADVNGDKRADAVVYFGDGRWFVAASNGGGFNNYSQWGSVPLGSNGQFLADVNGDKRADAVVSFHDGNWFAALSKDDQRFDGPTQWTSGHGIGATETLLGDSTGDGRADAVAYFGNSGTWYLARADCLGCSPRNVVINSFNEYSEQTAVAPAINAGAEPWPSPDYYWDLTRYYIGRLYDDG